jgi:transposase
MTIHPGVIGIDVSKASLDIFDLARGRPERLPNDAEVAHALAQRLSARPGAFAVFEATDPYDRQLRGAFKARQVGFVRVNPSRARAFAQAIGRQAKTDAIDARTLAQMSQLLDPPKPAAPDPGRDALASLNRRRDQLVADRAAEKVRLREIGDPHGSCQSHIAWLDAEIARIEALIAATIAADARLAADRRLLCSVPGIGAVGATTLLAQMPELGTLTPKTAAALAGLAPINVDSGTFRGLRRIRGGRARVRRALYMAAVTAIRAKARFKDLFQALIARGKPAKLALTAIARKLIVILNAVMRDRKPFQPT